MWNCIDPPQWVLLLCSGKNPTDDFALSTPAFYVGVAFKYRSLQALKVSLAKACPSPSLIWHQMKEWMDLYVRWSMLDDTYNRYKLSSNIPPTFIKHFFFHRTCWIKHWNRLTRLLVTQLKGVQTHFLKKLQKMYSTKKNLVNILLTENILHWF